MALRAVLQTRLEGRKAQLIKCGPGEFQTIQGEARALDKLLNDIERSTSIEENH